jgi:ribosomal protein S9
MLGKADAIAVAIARGIAVHEPELGSILHESLAY